MKKILSILILVSLQSGCQSVSEKKAPSNEEKSKNSDTIQIVARVDTAADKVVPASVPYSISWSDSLLKMYVLFSDNPLIKQSRKEEEWLFDQTIETDTAVYNRYQIGHDVSEEDGTSLRFITDQWVCLDTAKKLLYEYDDDGEKLNKWEPAIVLRKKKQ